MKLKAGIIVFLGTNCDRDTKMALEKCGFKPEFVFHDTKNLEKYDLIVLPGGFSFGDYIRAGRLAKLSPAVLSLKNFKGFILGICNGFQILTECGLLPGALIENSGTKFICQDEPLIFNDTEINLPIAHKEGCFWADEADLKLIEEKAGTQFDPELIGVFKSILPAAANEIKDFETKMKFQLKNEEQALGH